MRRRRIDDALYPFSRWLGQVFELTRCLLGGGGCGQEVMRGDAHRFCQLIDRVQGDALAACLDVRDGGALHPHTSPERFLTQLCSKTSLTQATPDLLVDGLHETGFNQVEPLPVNAIDMGQ